MNKLRSNKNKKTSKFHNKKIQRRILSVTQILTKVKKKEKRQIERKRKKEKKLIKPLTPKKGSIIRVKEKPKKIIYSAKIIDYKNPILLLRYLRINGKIVPRHRTKLPAKQHRLLVKVMKTARIMGFLPFVRKEKGFFR